MSTLDRDLGKGHYAKKQIFSKDWLISWTHRTRFKIGLELAAQFAGKRVLDYGCGDGSFLRMMIDGGSAPSFGVGAELHTDLVNDCRTRFEGQPGLSFVLNDELDLPCHQGLYDGVICMEVLEHVVDVDAVLDRFVRLLAPEGRLLFSVPVETGLPLLVKQSVRRIAGWRGIGDYPGMTPYTLRELCASVLANGKRQHIVRPIHRNAVGGSSHDHKGFNWMAFRETLGQRFETERILSSPLRWLPPHLASQVWFLLRQ